MLLFVFFVSTVLYICLCCFIPRHLRIFFLHFSNGRYGDYLFNYGCLPQTWEDPAHISDETGLKGDNDPIDVLEIGTRQLKPGEV